MKRDITYLQLLSKSFPTAQSACSEIINLEAILNLPKGTEHFVTDLHGEYAAFDNVLRNGSGAIKEVVCQLFHGELTDEEQKQLCTLIYYPEGKLERVESRGADLDEWYKSTLARLIKVLQQVSSKYTRSKVRKALPRAYAYIIEELLQESKGGAVNKESYLESIFESIVSTESAGNFVIAICNVIRRLTIDSLHVIGDIYDRGSGAHLIMDRLLGYHDFDIQWGNHDLVWMGAAAGSKVCIANVLRICFKYNNILTLEEGYGINLLPLATFAMETYKDDPCICFMPDSGEEEASAATTTLVARMHKAIAVIQFKLEAEVIRRNPEFKMESRNLIENMDLKQGRVRVDGKEYDLRTTIFPTINMENPSELTMEESTLMDQLAAAFTGSKTLSKHIECLYSHGSLYLVRNNNLLYHGSVPLNPDGTFAEMEIEGARYSGKALFDKIDRLVRIAYFENRNAALKQKGLDMVWYLWCGPVSPPFDKDRMTTFERYFISDKSTHKETKGNYYRLKNDPKICDMILREFGIEDVEHAHIINGHIPVKAMQGESPIKAGGRLLVIDGGFSKAYREETGIAGYTLIYSSHGLKLVQHEPFESSKQIIETGLDVIQEETIVEFSNKRQTVRNTDKGRELGERIDDLKQLLQAYRSGLIRG